MKKAPIQVRQLPKVLSPMTDSTGKRDCAPRRSCSVQDSTATRMERLDYKPERQVLGKRMSEWYGIRRDHPTVCRSWVTSIS